MRTVFWDVEGNLIEVVCAPVTGGDGSIIVALLPEDIPAEDNHPLATGKGSGGHGYVCRHHGH